MIPIAAQSLDALTAQVSDITRSEHNLVSLDDRLIRPSRKTPSALAWRRTPSCSGWNSRGC